MQHTRCDLKQCLTSILKDRFVFGQRVNGVNQYRCVYVRDEYVYFECVECVGQAQRGIDQVGGTIVSRTLRCFHRNVSLR